MAGDKPTIYLRNVFHLKWDADKTYLRMFLEGKRKFIETTREKGWKLVAAFAEWPLLNDKHVVEPELEMVQIWQLDDWSRLYNTMVGLSETGWYRALGHALASEDQELLINAVAREPEREIKWVGDDQPGYTYVYEVSRPQEGCNHSYLREVNWFDAQMCAKHGWELVWLASQVTAQPAQISVLWRVPDPGRFNASSIPQALVDIAQIPRYNERMLSSVQTLRRRIYYPIYTERLAELVAGQNP